MSDPRVKSDLRKNGSEVKFHKKSLSRKPQYTGASNSEGTRWVKEFALTWHRKREMKQTSCARCRASFGIQECY
jgi:hypothetical protein